MTVEASGFMPIVFIDAVSAASIFTLSTSILARPYRPLFDYLDAEDTALQ